MTRQAARPQFRDHCWCCGMRHSARGLRGLQSGACEGRRGLQQGVQQARRCPQNRGRTLHGLQQHTCWKAAGAAQQRRREPRSGPPPHPIPPTPQGLYTRVVNRQAAREARHACPARKHAMLRYNVAPAQRARALAFALAFPAQERRSSFRKHPSRTSTPVALAKPPRIGPSRGLAAASKPCCQPMWLEHSPQDVLGGPKDASPLRCQGLGRPAQARHRLASRRPPNGPCMQ